MNFIVYFRWRQNSWLWEKTDDDFEAAKQAAKQHQQFQVPEGNREANAADASLRRHDVRRWMRIAALGRLGANRADPVVQIFIAPVLIGGDLGVGARFQQASYHLADPHSA